MREFDVIRYRRMSVYEIRAVVSKIKDDDMVTAVWEGDEWGRDNNELMAITGRVYISNNFLFFKKSDRVIAHNMEPMMDWQTKSGAIRWDFFRSLVYLEINT